MTPLVTPDDVKNLYDELLELDESGGSSNDRRTDMDLETANRLPEGAPVVHSNRGPGIWWGVDRWDKTTCCVEFPDDGDAARVTLACVEVR